MQMNVLRAKLCTDKLPRTPCDPVAILVQNIWLSWLPQSSKAAWRSLHSDEHG